MRQLTPAGVSGDGSNFSKLPMRQLTNHFRIMVWRTFSKLPMRQLTPAGVSGDGSNFSKLPMRQLTLR
ncbi:hypothetical protein GCWU000321_00549 [Dialister invisus DSM 15470]|uniref:Uncharacterized protein n=1 Tax=Dialister invisus DSM 15470 TaxID=592028 RepID=C9LM17_9FIRM|nr:hypothetical protein GCWU000321_00549 [Dialister invisus DSM 15470]